MTWSDAAIPCQVPGHEHVAACDSDTGFRLPFCEPHFDALPVRLQRKLIEVAEASIYETENHAVALDLLVEGKRRLSSPLLSVPGICRKCGCTDEFGCDGGCSWVNARRTLCSRCAPAKPKGR
ncbi:MAG TPA: hypothetical protein VFV10_14270 [Gammaproteobacteria bacterium]|nr:hypothetical protein [Gammaproteobacteria bacterium]